VERLPPALWPTLGAAWRSERTDGRLARAVRAAFDPVEILNPGILGAAAPAS
jgi:hypothetical protein